MFSSMTVLQIFADLPAGFIETLAGVFCLVIVGKFAHNETRLMTTAIAACLAFPHPATLFGVALLGVLFRAFDFVNIVRGD